MSNEIDFEMEMQELANIIAQYAPENWEKMNLICEFYSEADYGFDSWAIVAGEKTPVDFDEEDLDALESVFSKIRKKTIEEWSIAEFMFTCEGDCELNFQY